MARLVVVIASLSACLSVASASATNTATTTTTASPSSLTAIAPEVCPGEGPAVLSPPTQTSDFATANASPREVSKLGDRRRSTEASGTFFNSLDHDGDGSLEHDELAKFLRDQIGGSAFDTEVEVEEGVVTVMERLDQGRDDGLEKSDVFLYWVQLETLLTAEEVADWVVHAVQLPAYVGKIFLENGVTGYDFSELVERDGEILVTELGIDRPSFVKKIVRHIHSRMLGIGSAPGAPPDFRHELESCSTVSLNWNPSTGARVFSVHGYRLQRRAIDLFEKLPTVMGSGDGEGGGNKALGVELPMVQKSDWTTVYSGGENEFVDTSLELGHNYFYRVQAWNSVGKSPWASTDVSKSLKRFRCSKKSSRTLDTGGNENASMRGNNDIGWDSWTWAYLPVAFVRVVVLIFQFMYSSINAILGAVAMVGAIMRYRRASAPTSSGVSAVVLPFPLFWTKINSLTFRVFGAEIIPKTLLGDSEAIRRQERVHDELMNTTGLRGYHENEKKRKTIGAAVSDLTTDNSTTIANARFDRRGLLEKHKSYSTGELSSTFRLPNSVSFAARSNPREPPPPSNGMKFPTSPWKRFRTKRSTITENSESESLNAVDESNTNSTASSRRQRGSSSLHKSKTPSRMKRSRSVDESIKRKKINLNDNTVCIVCQRNFKIGYRWKHFCAQCMSAFCHKCGQTTHNHLMSCKFPGDCFCGNCIIERKRRAGTRSSSAGDDSVVSNLSY